MRSAVPCSILDVTGCKWPVRESNKVPGGHLFCNAVRAGHGPYCASHAAQAYGIGTPSERRATAKMIESEARG